MDVRVTELKARSATPTACRRESRIGSIPRSGRRTRAATPTVTARVYSVEPRVSHRCLDGRGVQHRKPNPELVGIDAVLFLDVDGVLHPPNPRHERLQFRTSCMELLRDVLQQTGAKIVLSTTWRLNEGARDHLARKLAEHGCPSFVSKTPSIAQFQRPKEILSWVGTYQPVRWVAVDDWPLHEDVRMAQHFVQTRPRHGLEPDTAGRIISLFSKQHEANDIRPSHAAS